MLVLLKMVDGRGCVLPRRCTATARSHHRARRHGTGPTGTLLATRMADDPHVTADGTLIRTARSRALGLR
jgi:hypothetical protein